MGTLDQARAVKRKAAEIFGRHADVVGVGIVRLNGGYGLKINLRSTPSTGEPLPRDVDGVPTRVEIVGDTVPINR